MEEKPIKFYKPMKLSKTLCQVGMYVAPEAERIPLWIESSLCTSTAKPETLPDMDPNEIIDEDF